MAPSMTLALETSDRVIFLYAGGANDEEPRTSDAAALFTLVALTIPPKHKPPDRIASLSVTLEAMENLGFPSGIYETNTPFRNTVECHAAVGMALQPAKVYQFELPPLFVEHSAPPYERSSAGRVYWRLSAKLVFSGMLKKTLTAEKQMFVTGLPAKASVLEYARTHRGIAEHLGAVLFHLRSQHLTVGGYTRVAFSLLNASPTLELLSLSLSLNQQTTLVSRQRDRRTERAPTSRVKFWEVGARELAETRNPDGSFDGNWIARLPDDNAIRPSTLSGSDAAIRISHTIEMRIVYAPEPGHAGEPIVYNASWPLTLVHCACVWRSLRLPSYSAQDPSPVPSRSRDDWEPQKYRSIHLSQTDCACGMDLKELMAYEDEADDEQHICTTQAMCEEMHAQRMARTVQGVRPRPSRPVDGRSSAAEGWASSRGHGGVGDTVQSRPTSGRGATGSSEAARDEGETNGAGDADDAHTDADDGIVPPRRTSTREEAVGISSRDWFDEAAQEQPRDEEEERRLKRKNEYRVDVEDYERDQGVNDGEAAREEGGGVATGEGGGGEERGEGG